MYNNTKLNFSVNNVLFVLSVCQYGIITRLVLVRNAMYQVSRLVYNNNFN